MAKIISFCLFLLTLIVGYILIPGYKYPLDVVASNAIDKKLLTIFAENEVGGAYLISRDGQVTNEKYAGYSNYFTKDRITPDSLFSIGTLSQQYTGHIFYNLFGKKALNPDYKVKLFENELEGRFMGEQSLRDLISMKALAPKSFMSGRTLKWQLGVTADEKEVMRFLKETYPAHNCNRISGKKTCYSEISYRTLGLVLEKFYKKKWSEILNETIIIPYNLDQSSFNLMKSEKLVRGHYALTENKLVPMPIWDHLYNVGNGGIKATLRDYYRYQLMISRQMEDMLSPDKYFEYSEFLHGWIVTQINGNKVFWNWGTDVGFQNLVVRVPSKRLIVIIFLNVEKGVESDFSHQLLKTIFNII